MKPTRARLFTHENNDLKTWFFKLQQFYAETRLRRKITRTLTEKIKKKLQIGYLPYLLILSAGGLLSLRIRAPFTNPIQDHTRRYGLNVARCDKTNATTFIPSFLMQFLPLLSPLLLPLSYLPFLQSTTEHLYARRVRTTTTKITRSRKSSVARGRGRDSAHSLLSSISPTSLRHQHSTSLPPSPPPTSPSPSPTLHSTPSHSTPYHLLIASKITEEPSLLLTTFHSFGIHNS